MAPPVFARTRLLPIGIPGARRRYAPTATGYANRTAPLRGLFRVADAALEGYRVWVGAGVDPDPDGASPDVETDALPVALSAAAGTARHVVVRRRNRYGVESRPDEVVVVDVAAGGTIDPPAPSAPSRLTLTASAGGAVRVRAEYDNRADGGGGAAPESADRPDSTGLAASWDLTDADAPYADASGNGLDLTEVAAAGAASVETDQDGAWVELDTDGQHLDAGDADALRVVKADGEALPLVLAMAVKPTSDTPLGSAAVHLAAKGDAAGTDLEWECRIDASGTSITLVVYDAAGASQSATVSGLGGVLAVGTPVHVVVSLDPAADTGTLVVNEDADGLSATTAALAGGMFSAGGSLRFGRAPGGGGGGDERIRLRRVRVYRLAGGLSAAERDFLVDADVVGAGDSAQRRPQGRPHAGLWNRASSDAADSWELFVTTDGSDPDPDADAPAATASMQRPTGRVTDVFSAELGPYADGTVVKAAISAVRSSDDARGSSGIVQVSAVDSTVSPVSESWTRLGDVRTVGR